MTHKTPLAIRLGLVILLWAFAAAIGAVGTGGTLTAPARAQQRLPLFFVPTLGQAGAAAAFTLRSAQLSAQFTAAQTRFDFGEARLTVRFAGANPQVRLEAADPLPGRVNYLLGSRREQWQTDVPTYGTILYHDLYPGIDLAYSVAEGRLKSEFRVSPGADPGAIRWQYRGGAAPRIPGDGGLVVAAGGGELREQPPVMYQEEDGRRVPVQGTFRLLDGGLAGFATGAFDHQRPLVIDPILSYSTYLGGGGQDSARAIAVDAAGYAYVAGYTDSTDFPSATPLQTKSGGVDAFVAKLNPAGNALVYCTYLGGGWDDRAFSLATDARGNVYVAGWTYSPNFPTTAGARQRSLGGGRDAFVSKLNPAGNSLVYSTYLGGGGHDSANAIAVDAAGNAYIAGDTYSSDFPVSNAFQGSSGGGQDGFVAKLNPAGSALLWSTYLGGNGDDRANALALDASGNIYVTGGTFSTNFPTFHAMQPTNAGGQDAFVTKLAVDGRTLVYSTYLGGSGGSVTANEAGAAIRVDAAGSAYIAGTTSSTNFPLANAFQSALGGGGIDAFVTRLNSTGSALVYSTYLGGTGADYATAASLSPSGALAVVGYTMSSNFPVAAALQTAKSGGYDGFVTRFSPAGNTLETSTYWGGSGSEAIYAVSMDRAGTMWIAGQTLSVNYPLKNPLQTLNEGGYGAIVAKMGDNVPVAAFRDYNGNTRLTAYGSSVIFNAGGWITSDPALWQTATGDTYVVAGNGTCIYMNTFKLDSQSWAGWWQVGCQRYGNPAVVALASGEAYVVARDAAFGYWINRYIPSQGFQGWIALGGTLVTEPSAAVALNGTIYIAGRAANGAVWSGRYVPGTGFLGWSSGGAGAPVTVGKPAIAAGSDGAMYIVTRAGNWSTWIVRLQADTWGTWYSGGGWAMTDPDLAAASGTLYVAVTGSSSGVWVRPYGGCRKRLADLAVDQQLSAASGDRCRGEALLHRRTRRRQRPVVVRVGRGMDGPGLWRFGRGQSDGGAEVRARGE
jgi:hypothetical protein